MLNKVILWSLFFTDNNCIMYMFENTRTFRIHTSFSLFRINVAEVFSESSSISTLGISGSCGPMMTSVLSALVPVRENMLPSSLFLLRSCRWVVRGINLSTPLSTGPILCCIKGAGGVCPPGCTFRVRDALWPEYPQVSAQLLPYWGNASRLWLRFPGGYPVFWDTLWQLEKQDGSQVPVARDPGVPHRQSEIFEMVFLGPSTFFNTKQSLKQQRKAASLFHVITSSNGQEKTCNTITEAIPVTCYSQPPFCDSFFLSGTFQTKAFQPGPSAGLWGMPEQYFSSS